MTWTTHQYHMSKIMMNTPWNINMEPKNHLFQKENHVNQTIPIFKVQKNVNLCFFLQSSSPNKVKIQIKMPTTRYPRGQDLARKR